MRKVLVVAAHPDDEILGCGGTIAKHVQNGDEVNVIILAEGITSRIMVENRDESRTELASLAKVAQEANKLLGVANLVLHDFPDNRMDSLERLDVIKVVEKYINQFRPEIVYTHHSGDVNIDHRIAHEAVVTSCRPLPNHSVKRLLFFEVPSSTEYQPPLSQSYFMPNWYNEISKVLHLKGQALKIYNSEMRAWPHPRSVENLEYLARWRGASVGVDAAEAFILGRNLVNN